MINSTGPTRPVNAKRSRLDWALTMAEAGFAVFPVEAGGKSPRNTGWQSQATTDPDQIKQWFADAPAINYGLALRDGQAVVDLDCKGKSDGLKAFEAVALDHDMAWADPDDAPCFTVETPSGGRHLYVKAGFPVGLSGKEWPAGIDVRGTGGYVLGPGSIIEGKPYRARSQAVTVPQAPQWIAQRFRQTGAPRAKADDSGPLFELDKPSAIALARDRLSRRPPAIQGQGGDQHTLVTAMQLRDIGLSEGMALDIMCEDGGWNAKCDPPWDRDELAVKVANAYRYAREQAGSRPDGADVFAEASQAGADAPQDVGPALLPCYLEGQLDALPAWSYLIDDVLPERSLHMIHGQPDALKTFTALDMVMHGAAGRPWPSPPSQPDWAVPIRCKRYSPARKLRVAYLATEGVAGLRKRVQAWKQYHRFDDELAVAFLPDCPTLDYAANLDSVVHTLKHVLGTVDWVVVDTLFGVAGELDVTKAPDSSILVKRFKSIMAELNCSVTVIHHDVKGNGGFFGSQVWYASLDAMDECRSEYMGPGVRGVVVTNEKTKDETKRQKVTLNARVEDLGRDSRNRRQSTLVLVADPQAAQKSEEEQDPDAARLDIALEVLEGQRLAPLDYLAKAIVAREQGQETFARMSNGEQTSKVDTVKRWIRREATNRLESYANKASNAKNAPWEFSDPKRGAIRKADAPLE